MSARRTRSRAPAHAVRRAAARLAAALLFAVTTAAVATTAAADAPPRASHADPARAPSVILLSWDGVRHDYPDRVPLPGLERMAREGARADRLVPVFPTSTFPNHVSLITGAPPDRHGVVGNVFRDREHGVFSYSDDASTIEAEPLWAAAERQGVRTATFFWVGSAGDWRGTRPSLRRVPFDGDVEESEKVDQILAWLDLPGPERPRLICSWWHGADSAGHRHGPDAPEVAEQLRGQDAELRRLLAGLDARRALAHTTLFVVSDHGMTRIEGGIDAENVLEDHGIEAEAIPGGGVVHVFLTEPGRRDEARAVLAGLPDVRVHFGDALPPELRYAHPRRTGDLVALVDPPRFFTRDARQRRTPARGGHGYAPGHPDMAGIFFAVGRGVPAGLSPGRVRALDVAPSVAHLLGIEPPRHAEGRPLPWLRGAARKTGP